MYRPKFFKSDHQRIKIDGRHAYIQTKRTNGEWSKAALELTKNLNLCEMLEDKKDTPLPRASHKVIEDVISNELESRCLNNG